VLNDVPGQVGAATRQRVRRAIRDLDFRPNALARSLHQKRTCTIGLIIPDISNPYYAEIARGIEDALSRQGYSLFTCNTDRRVEKISQYAIILREKRVDGIILGGGATWEPRHFAALRSSGVEAVLIGRYGVSLPAVRVDNVKGARLAAGHLLGLGHRDIAVIAGPRQSTTTADRLAGYRGAFAEHEVRLPASRCLYGDLRPESGRCAAESLLRARRPPTAVLAANDQMAIGAIRALLQHGLTIPGDVSVVGFDDIALASFITPALTTMALPLYRMGVAAADMMLHALAGDGPAQEAWFTPELVVRESSGAPAGAARRNGARPGAGRSTDDGPCPSLPPRAQRAAS
jgi:LacI family transcriptional regulator